KTAGRASIVAAGSTLTTTGSSTSLSPRWNGRSATTRPPRRSASQATSCLYCPSPTFRSPPPTLPPSRGWWADTRATRPGTTSRSGAVHGSAERAGRAFRSGPSRPAPVDGASRAARGLLPIQHLFRLAVQLDDGVAVRAVAIRVVIDVGPSALRDLVVVRSVEAGRRWLAWTHERTVAWSRRHPDLGALRHVRIAKHVDRLAPLPHNVDLLAQELSVRYDALVRLAEMLHGSIGDLALGVPGDHVLGKHVVERVVALLVGEGHLDVRDKILTGYLDPGREGIAEVLHMPGVGIVNGDAELVRLADAHVARAEPEEIGEQDWVRADDPRWDVVRFTRLA